MDHEAALISKVLRTRTGMRRAMQARIGASYFEDETNRRAWLWCIDYWKEYGEAPTEAAFKEDYPEYRLVRVAEPFDYVIAELHERRRHNLITDMLEKVTGIINEDEPVGSRSKAAVEVIQKTMSRISVETSSARDTNTSKTVDERIERYQDMATNRGKILGISTGYPTLDRACGGFQPEQLITLVGLSKAGKSIVLMNMAIEAYSLGQVPLFVSFEMSNREQELRFDGMNAGINYRKIMEGALSKSDWTELTRSMRGYANFGDFILSSDSSGGMTLGGIAAKAEQHYPDIIFVDGVYMMDDEDGAEKGTPRALTNITRGMKRLAQRLRIPIVGTTQALSWKVGSKKKGLTSEAIGYTSSFVQDSDLVVVMFHEEDRPDVAKLRITESRMGPKGEFSVHWDFDRMNFQQTDDVLHDIPRDDDGENHGGF